MKIDLFDDEMFDDEPQPPERPPREPRRRRRRRGETAKRVLVALPWIAFAIAITVAGGIVFAAGDDRDRRRRDARVRGDRRALPAAG